MGGAQEAAPGGCGSQGQAARRICKQRAKNRGLRTRAQLSGGRRRGGGGSLDLATASALRGRQALAETTSIHLGQGIIP